MRLSLRQLQVFLAIADTGSTVTAGDAVALSQSATSAALTQLERTLATRLFDRVGKRLILNDSGRALLPEARSLLDGASVIERHFSRSHADGPVELRIGASTTVGERMMPRLIASFLRQRPAAHIRLRIGNTRDVAAMVASFEADVGFTEGPSHEQRLHVVPWMPDELVVVAAPTHTIARGSRRVTIDALSRAEWLLREPGSGTREAVEQVLSPHLEFLRSRIELGSAEAIKLACAEGLGLACLSSLAVADFVAARRLKVLRTELPPLVRTFNIVYHEGKIISDALRIFMHHCMNAPGSSIPAGTMIRRSPRGTSQGRLRP